VWENCKLVTNKPQNEDKKGPFFYCQEENVLKFKFNRLSISLPRIISSYFGWDAAFAAFFVLAGLPFAIVSC